MNENDVYYYENIKIYREEVLFRKMQRLLKNHLGPDVAINLRIIINAVYER